MLHSHIGRSIRRALLLGGASASLMGAQTSDRTTLRGTIRDTAGALVPLVQVTLSGARAVTDSMGRYFLDNLPTGAGMLTARRLGFEPIDRRVQLVSGGQDSLHIVMAYVPGYLPGVTTEAEMLERLRLADFYRHREVGNGYFFNRKELDSLRVMRVSDVLRRLPGLRLAPDRTGRLQLRMSRSNCPPDFFIDGQRAPFLNVDDLPLGDIEAVEVYRGASGVPPEFNNRLGNPACGVIVLWTRLPG